MEGSVNGGSVNGGWSVVICSTLSTSVEYFRVSYGLVVTLFQLYYNMSEARRAK